MDRVVGRCVDPDERRSRDDEGSCICFTPEFMIILDPEKYGVSTITEGRDREIVVGAEYTIY
jgi:hypothetical protein